MLTAIIIGSGLVAWLVTRDRRYLALSGRVAKAALVFSLAVLVLMAAERLIIL
ncbi:MAG: hypothetical protein WCI19_10285 [Betaproteobacteria bacterium]|nr:hypothetical protein [Rhodocyclales bacterium]